MMETAVRRSTPTAPSLRVRSPAGTIGPSGTAGFARRDDGDERGLGARNGHPEILRDARPRATAGDPSQTGAGRSAASLDRQMAPRGRAGGRGGDVPGEAGTPQGGVLSPLLANVFLH